MLQTSTSLSVALASIETGRTRVPNLMTILLRRIQLPLFGSHLSIAGGYYKAVETAASLGMDTVQLFTKNNNQWKGYMAG